MNFLYSYYFLNHFDIFPIKIIVKLIYVFYQKSLLIVHDERSVKVTQIMRKKKIESEVIALCDCISVMKVRFTAKFLLFTNPTAVTIWLFGAIDLTPSILHVLYG